MKKMLAALGICGLCMVLYSCLPRCQKVALKVPKREIIKAEEPDEPAPDTLPPIKRGIEGIGKVGKRYDVPKDEVVEEKKKPPIYQNKSYPFQYCRVRYKHIHCGIAEIDEEIGRPDMSKCRKFRGVRYTRRQHLQQGDKFRTFPKPKPPKLKRDELAADTKSPEKKARIRIEKPK